MNKKAEGDYKWIIVGFILVAIVAVIILLFIKNWDFAKSDSINKEICHNSVLTRNNAITKGTSFTPEIFPLKCKTSKIEIKTADEKEIQKTIANAMYDCWWMLGEGEMDFMPSSGLFKPESAECVICSIIEFDEKVKEKNLQLDLTDYLENTKIPQKDITYSAYFEKNAGDNAEVGIISPQIETSQDQAVVFVFVRESKLIEISRRALYCDSEESCRVLRVIPLTSEEISKICQRIESIP